jgi:nicotinamide-nucleotide amidase
MFTDAQRQQATDVLEHCRRKGLLMATAESCTGGLIGALLTDISGSSDVFERGFTTYSYRSKTELLGVETSILEQHGAVSEQVVTIMAQQAMLRSKVDIAVAVSGIAGPGGAVAGKPVGTVYIGVATKQDTVVRRYQFDGDRTQVRIQTVETALTMLQDSLNRSFVYVA